jgi:HEPN domain-containing protein
MNGRREGLDILVSGWVEKAEHDYYAAKQLFESIDVEVPFDVVCFHAQQCVEKYPKAVCISLGTPAPRIHDLSELRLLLPADLKNSIHADELAELNPYAVDIRYPGVMETVTKEDTEKALSISSRICSICMKFLSEKRTLPT